MAVQGVDLIRSQIEKQGELTRAEIARLLQENKLPYEGQAIVHILFKAVCGFGVCPGADRGNKPTFTLFETKYGSFKPRPREEALAMALVLAVCAPARRKVWRGRCQNQRGSTSGRSEENYAGRSGANWMLRRKVG
jgi:hypothetical protein